MCGVELGGETCPGFKCTSALSFVADESVLGIENLGHEVLWEFHFLKLNWSTISENPENGMNLKNEMY